MMPKCLTQQWHKTVRVFVTFYPGKMQRGMNQLPEKSNVRSEAER